MATSCCDLYNYAVDWCNYRCSWHARLPIVSNRESAKIMVSVAVASKLKYQHRLHGFFRLLYQLRLRYQWIVSADWLTVLSVRYFMRSRHVISVLSSHGWYRLYVASDAIYSLDLWQNTFQILAFLEDQFDLARRSTTMVAKESHVCNRLTFQGHVHVLCHFTRICFTLCSYTASADVTVSSSVVRHSGVVSITI